MDLKSKILLWVLLVLIIITISFSFYKVFIKKDLGIYDGEVVEEIDGE